MTFNTSSLLWNTAKHHGQAVHVLNGIVKLGKHEVARFASTESAAETLKLCRWRFVKDENGEVELRAD